LQHPGVTIHRSPLPWLNFAHFNQGSWIERARAERTRAFIPADAKTQTGLRMLWGRIKQNFRKNRQKCCGRQDVSYQAALDDQSLAFCHCVAGDLTGDALA